MPFPSSCIEVDEKTASSRFQLSKHLGSFGSWQYDNYLKDRPILLCEGDLDVAGDLRLDWEQWPRGTTGLIVTGDLNVTGSILNTVLEGGAFLYVLGSVRARHFLAGGADIVINGDVELSEVLYAHYNDGSLVIHGSLRAPVLINDDHYVGITGKTDVEWSDDTGFAHSDDDEDFPEALRALLVPEVAFGEDLFDEIASGRSVLKRFAALRPQRSYEEWRQVVEGSPERLRSVPAELVDAGLCEMALEVSPAAVKYIPAPFLSDALCEKVLCNSGHYLEDIPWERRSRALCLLAAGNRTRLEYIPEEHWDDEVLEAVLRNDGSEIGNLPESRVNPRLATAAVAGGANFYVMPKSWQTDEIVIAALGDDPHILETLSPGLVTSKVYERAVERYAGHPEWKRIVDEHRLPERVDEDNFCKVWSAFLTENSCIGALESGLHLYAVPRDFLTQRVCQAAIKADLFNFSWMPQAFMTSELCARAVRHDYGKLLEYVPGELKTLELCLASVTANGATLEFVPHELRTPVICKAALEDDVGASAFVPMEQQDVVLGALIGDFQGQEEGGRYWFLQRALHRLNPKRPAGIDPSGAIEDARQAIARGYDGNASSFFALALAYKHLGDAFHTGIYAATAMTLDDTFESDPDFDDTWLQAAADDFIRNLSIEAWPEVLRASPILLGHAPEALLTAELCEEIAGLSDAAISHVPDAVMTPALYTIAVRAGHKSFKDVPEHMLTEQCCIEEVTGSGWRLERIPLQWRTFEVCRVAAMESTQANPHIPEELRDSVLAYVDAHQEKPALSDKMFRKALEPGNKWLFFVWIMGTMLGKLFGKQDKVATLRGPLGWLELRPMVVMMGSALISAVFLGTHLWVSIHAWQSAGALAGILSLIGFFAAEFYWGWQEFSTQGPTLLAVLAPTMAALTLISGAVRRRLAFAWANW